jgi:hypothetical protein
MDNGHGWNMSVLKLFPYLPFDSWESMTPNILYIVKSGKESGIFHAPAEAYSPS